MRILVDTREQPTERARKRYQDFGIAYDRRKLEYGDYSAEVTAGAQVISMERAVVIERKMNISELCSCFCHERKRFTAEMERARADGAKIYLLVEGGSWEKVYAGSYRSQMQPKALVASILAFCARYNLMIVFCRADTSGKLIADILYRETKEILKNY